MLVSSTNKKQGSLTNDKLKIKRLHHFPPKHTRMDGRPIKTVNHTGFWSQAPNCKSRIFNEVYVPSCLLVNLTFIWSLESSLGVLQSKTLICSSFRSFEFGAKLDSFPWDSWANHCWFPPEAKNNDCSRVARIVQPATRAPWTFYM